MNLVELYAKLKSIALDISLDRELGEDDRRLLERYGITGLLELDNFIHNLHKKLRITDESVSTSGDGLVIYGLLMYLGNPIYFFKGDGVKNPIRILSRFLLATVDIGLDAVYISYELDLPVDYIEYGLSYVDGIEGYINDMKRLMSNKEVELKTKEHPSLMIIVDDLSEIFGDRFESNMGTVTIRGLRDWEIEHLSRVISIVDFYIENEVPKPKNTIGKRNLKDILNYIRDELEIPIEFIEPRVETVHPHLETGTIDIHLSGEIKLPIKTMNTIALTSSILTILNKNYETIGLNNLRRSVLNTLRRMNLLPNRISKTINLTKLKTIEV